MPDNRLIKTNPSYDLMRARMRERQQNQDWRYMNPAVLEEEAKLSRGFEDNAMRLRTGGGHFQQNRMIFDKRRSLDEALFYSYQAADIIKLNPKTQSTENMPMIRALINPNKLKQDYDDKILSVHREEQFKPGDVFEWVNTNTFWLVYLQDLDELAYFRGDIRKCSYEIEWEDEQGERHSTYAAIRGPVETKIEYLQKHDTSLDRPNHSLNILIPKNEDTLNYFQRYSKFYLQDEEFHPSNICWRVEAVDWISMKGVIEVNATEYYSNLIEDDVDAGIVGGLIVKEPEPPQTEPAYITGESFIKPKIEYVYKYTGFRMPGDWQVDKKAPVKLVVDEDNPRLVHITWISTYSGQFELSLGDNKKTIVVESLF